MIANRNINVVFKSEKPFRLRFGFPAPSSLWDSEGGEEDGRHDIRMPRERPSKSWWNIIAVTKEAVDDGLVVSSLESKAMWLTELRSGSDRKRQSNDKRM